MPRGLHPNSRKNLERGRPFQNCEEIARKHAKKSHETRRENKRMKEQLRIAMEIITEEEIEKLGKTKDTSSKKKILEKAGFPAYILAKIIAFGDPKLQLWALSEYWDRTEGKPKQAIDIQEKTEYQITEEDEGLLEEEIARRVEIALRLEKKKPTKKRIIMRKHSKNTDVV